MSTQHQQILDALKSKEWVYNDELQMIAHRFGARLQELRDGAYDGTNYIIESTNVKPGQWKYRLVTQEAAEMEKALTGQVVPQYVPPEKDTYKKPDPNSKGMKSWRAMGEKLKRRAPVVDYETAAKELEAKLRQMDEWFDLNKSRMTPAAKQKTLDKLMQMQERLDYFFEMSKGGEK